MGVNEIGQSLKGEVSSFLSGKPIWAYWLAYAGFTAVLFGVFFAAFALLGSTMWVTAIVILGVGTIWGSTVYSRRSTKKETKSQEKVA